MEKHPNRYENRNKVNVEKIKIQFCVSTAVRYRTEVRRIQTYLAFRTNFYLPTWRSNIKFLFNDMKRFEKSPRCYVQLFINELPREVV